MSNRTLSLAISLASALLILLLAQEFLALAGPRLQESDLGALSTIDRTLEPIVVKGPFSGVPVDQLFVYREVGGVWEQIPFQIDEVTASGNYTAVEDNLMDANDEIVFMAKDLGDQATTSITASLTISDTFYEVAVSDPLAPAKKGWAYIVRSHSPGPGSPVDYAGYTAGNLRINTATYAVGWEAAAHAGLNYLSLSGSSDLLDRTKLRVHGFFLGIPFKRTEEDLSVPPIVLIKDGPVRVIVKRSGATTFGYESLLHTITPIDLSAVPGTITLVRVSTDLASTTGSGTFYNENQPGGVTIDGNPDIVGLTLTKSWRQVSLSSGSLIQVLDLGAIGGTVSHYYKDNSTIDGTDTGDQRSYGDSGVMIANPSSDQFTTETAQYILPGSQSNRGNEFYNNFNNPLHVSIQIHGGIPTYLPLILKNN